MKNIKIKFKLITGFAIMTALSVIILLFSLFSSIDLVNTAMENKTNITIPLDNMGRFAIVYGNVRSATRDLGRTTTEEDNARHRTTLENNMNDSVQYIKNYLDLFEGNNTAHREEYEAVKSTYDALVSYRDIVNNKLIPAGMANDADTVFSTISVDLAPYGTSIRENINILTTLKSEQSEQSAVWASESLSNTIIIDLVLMLLIIATVILLVIYISNLISKPLSALNAYMKRAGGKGDISLSDEENKVLDKYGEAKDEIGQTITSIGAFIKHVIHIAEELESLAKGDLTIKIEVLSAADVMGVSVQHVADNLNRMFSDINAASVQVSTGSNQVSDGAQILAQGSTQQAASAEELSSSVSKIEQKTNENTDIAKQAAELSRTVIGNAEKGSRQMNEIMQAVKEINDASQSISKVIKSIDDIAFQTNILALNAAVEAARAGQHGKGFAVVAEEVRNLASKSAEAAQETSAMIENSMEKAELGARIAEETAASLTEIVSGINKSSNLIMDIARLSEEQTKGISQINTGINHVSQVVQQNSATAQESAAAAEEMSGQAALLQELVGKFKLLDSTMSHANILPAKSSSKLLAFEVRSKYGESYGEKY